MTFRDARVADGLVRGGRALANCGRGRVAVAASADSRRGAFLVVDVSASAGWCREVLPGESVDDAARRRPTPRIAGESAAQFSARLGPDARGAPAWVTGCVDCPVLRGSGSLAVAARKPRRSTARSGCSGGTRGTDCLLGSSPEFGDSRSCRCRAARRSFRYWASAAPLSVRDVLPKTRRRDGRPTRGTVRSVTSSPIAGSTFESCRQRVSRIFQIAELLDSLRRRLGPLVAAPIAPPVHMLSRLAEGASR